MDRMTRRALGLVIALTLALCAPAAAQEKVMTVKGASGPGPAKFDRVFVSKFGRADARRVLVLMPGTSGGAGNFTLVARTLVKRMPGIQVWAIDRRTQALEDTSLFRQVLAGDATLREAFDYYLGWLTDSSIRPHYTPLDAADFDFARDWGMSLALRDARRVVLKARAGGRRQVILGGHSLGASLTTAYASWDFNGKPGYRDIDGMVLIDGGLLGSFNAFTKDQAQAALDSLEESNPFADLIGAGLPEATGLFAEIGGLYSRLDPRGDATFLQDFPLLPSYFDPGFPVTFRGLFTYALDRDSPTPDTLSLIQVNAGSLAQGGDPRDWVDGGVTTAARLARAFGQEPSNGVEWFFPKRLSIDTNGANQLRQNGAAKLLGLRLRHLSRVDLPLYSIETSLAGGRVLLGARNFIKAAQTTKAESVLVDADPKFSHLDPLIASTSKNDFLETVPGFLRRAFDAADQRR